jgi:hypothetical protein
MRQRKRVQRLIITTQPRKLAQAHRPQLILPPLKRRREFRLIHDLDYLYTRQAVSLSQINCKRVRDELS